MYPYRNILPVTLNHQIMKRPRFMICYYNFSHDDIYCWIPKCALNCCCKWSYFMVDHPVHNWWEYFGSCVKEWRCIWRRHAGRFWTGWCSIWAPKHGWWRKWWGKYAPVQKCESKQNKISKIHKTLLFYLSILDFDVWWSKVDFKASIYYLLWLMLVGRSF